MTDEGLSKQFIEIDGLRLGYLAAGQGDPVVMVHGWPTFSHLWRHQIPALAERFSVYAVDLPGFGDSDKPTAVSYSLSFFGDILTGFLEALGIERATLICHDLGGPIVLLWAIRHPRRLDRLVIMDTVPYPDLPLMMRLMLPMVRLPVLGSAMVSRRGLRLALQLGTARKGVVTDELVAAYDRPFAGDPGARKTLLRILTGLELSELAEISDNLRGISAPTLVLWAEKDPSAPLSIARRLHADIDGAILKTIPSCGHFLTEDQPDEVNRALLEFLS